MSEIRVVSASAGTGKTHRLAQELERALAAGAPDRVAPKKILATTFTRKAAGELAQRAREHLVSAGLWEDAFRLDAGLIGTIHSVCDTLLHRFALEAGLPPRMAVLDEADVGVAFGVALAEVIDPTTLSRLEDLSRHFGLDAVRDRTWRIELQRIVEAARANGLDRDALFASAERSVAEVNALFPPPDAAGGQLLDKRFETSVVCAMERLQDGNDSTKTTAKYQDLIAEVHNIFRRGDVPGWALWVKLSKEKPAKASMHLASPIQEAARAHLQHPRLRTDLEDWIKLLFGLAADSLDKYQEWKRQRRLVDFVDQEVHVLRLLSRPDVRERLAADVHMVLVDEFQDTSPLELAVFLALAAVARRSLWVGDPKQSIFEFRGSDARLMKVALERIEEGRTPEILSTSRRSRPALVHLTSALFAAAFSDQYPREQVVLDPARPEAAGLPPPVHVWLLESKKREEVAASIAAGVLDLLGRDGCPPAQVCERATFVPRAIRPGDIAVLCRSNDHCAEVARSLEALGIRTALAREGLIATPEATLALACLRRLADTGDTLATAEIVTLCQDAPQPADWLAERIEYLRAGGDSWTWKSDHPTVVAIERQRRWMAICTPSELMDRVIEAAELATAVQSWGNVAVRLGNLDALRGVVRTYEDHCGRQGHAATIAGLLAWLPKIANTDQDKQAEGAGDDSVHVLTYYRAKGLEWPVVILDDLTKEDEGNPWWLSVADDRQQLDLAAPLAGRWLRYWPWPYGGQKTDTGLAESAASHPAAVNADRRELEESLRLLYVGFTRPRDILVLPMPGNGEKKLPWLDRLTLQDGKPRLHWPTEPGDHQLHIRDADLTIPVRTSRFAPRSAVPQQPTIAVWTHAPRLDAAHKPARVSVSSLPGSQAPIQIKRSVRVGGYLPIRGTDDIAAVGNAVHAFLAADDDRFPLARRVDMARDLQARFRVPGAIDPEGLVRRADELRTALLAAVPFTKWRTEWPIELLVDDQVVVGRADLVLETDEGVIVVDHKCHPGSEAERHEAAADHVGQLAAYGRAVSLATGRPLVGLMLHFAVAGELVEVDISGS